MIAAQSTPARKRFTFLMLIATCCMWTGDLRAQEASEVQEPRKEQSVTPGTEPQHTNRLVDSTSPYLLQHAHNPVDWYEWSEEAFDKAVREDKPVFLSIGYAACHWCHVMEHESFENEQVADYLNEHFVSIKVDREERPDIDEIYMQYTVQSTGRGGWPMSVWLMPDKSPFVAGTYFPREHFLEVLRRINNVWESDRGQITNGARQAANALNKWATGPEPAEDVIPQRTVARTAHLLKDHFDMKRGGLSSGGNKFPPSMAMDLMLRQYRHEESAALWEAVDITLDHMARGGIYDHLGGGICRYSTDPDWLVPHFEKMLYDQAMVSAIYLDGYQVSGKQAYADVAADIFQYVLTDLRSPEGGFYSSRDADSEGMEGKFYIWTVEQIIEVLGEEDGRLCCKYFDVTESGNWFENRGHAPAGPKNILRITQAPEQFARANDLKPNEFKQRLADWKKKLLAAREQRVPPGLDDKVLTAWNGLMIASLAKAGRVLDEPKYTQAAARAADFVLTNLHRDGRLLRTYRNGKARYTGYLDDYAFFISGLLYLYEADGDPKWLNTATTLADATIKYFADDQNGGFFFTADDGEELVTRSKSPHDNAIPSGNSVMAMNLLRLGLLTGEKAYRAQAESVFRAFQPQVARNPAAFERLLCAVDFYHDEVREIAILGDPADRGTERLLRTVYREYLPNKVVALSPGNAVDSPFPLLRGKTIRNSAPTAYVCENYRCQAPVNDHNELAGLLGFKAEPTPSTAEQ